MNMISPRMILRTLKLLSLFFIPNVNAACNINSVSAISFGDYNVFSLVDNKSTGSFTVTGCSSGARTFKTTLSRGSANTFTVRTMLFGGESLNYNLYTDATYSSIWGSGSSGTSSVSTTNSGSGTSSPIVIYGKIPAGQDASAGTYSDVITMTITF
jgi:spore coat protein U-like protein